MVIMLAPIQRPICPPMFETNVFTVILGSCVTSIYCREEKATSRMISPCFCISARSLDAVITGMSLVGRGGGGDGGSGGDDGGDGDDGGSGGGDSDD